MLKNIKSVQNKLLFIVIPVVVVTFLVLAFIITVNSKSVIELEINKKLETQVGKAISDINAHMQTHERLPIGLSKMVEGLGITPDNKQGYIEVIKKMPLTNEDTLGTGIFMATKSDGEFFCPYAYKVDGAITYTEDYFVDNTQEGWYVIGETSKDVAWSDPYFDPISSITMITATSPIRNATGKLIGVATGDMDFTNVQKIVSEIKVGQDGYAILLTKDGSYLSKGTETIAADENGVFPNITSDENTSLAEFGKMALQQKTGSGNFESDGDRYQAFISEMPNTGWIIILALPEKEIAKPILGIIFKVIAITVIALILLIVVLMLVAKNITSPLKPLKMDIEAISKGDFTRIIDQISNDEIGQISNAMNTMVTSLRETMTDVAISSKHVAETAEELEASAAQNGIAVEQVAMAATEISGSNIKISKVTADLDQLIQVVSHQSVAIEEQMNHVTRSLTSIDVMSSESNKSVKVLIQSMGSAFVDVNELSVIMNALKEQSGQIHSIVESIQGIAAQTNLLALNASIEAARAGDAGRGFAVVADEIRKLAEQSSGSANTISKIVTEISDATLKANVSTTRVVESIGDGQGDLTDVGINFENIATSISQIVKLIESADQLAKTISSQSEQAKQSAGELTALTDKSAHEAVSIAAATEEQLASVEEQTAATTGLAHIAEELQAKMSVFKV